MDEWGFPALDNVIGARGTAHSIGIAEYRCAERRIQLQAVLDRDRSCMLAAKPELFDAFLEHLGLVEGLRFRFTHGLESQLRCVRVGAISALDFAAVKGIFQGG